MLLAIDIGNTNISIGLFKGSRLIKRYSVPTYTKEHDRFLFRIAPRAQIKEIVICSVVPKVTGVLAKKLKSIVGIKPHIIGKDIVVPIKNLYRYPKQVGQDRLVNAYAALARFGAPVVVVDFGTAITFDVISKKKEYLGGLIVPGLRISLKALNEFTALLPKINLTIPREFIGRDTKNSMLSGIVYGYAALTDDISLRIKEKIGRNAKVIGTGGNIRLIGRYCRQLHYSDRDLTLKGINQIGRCLLFLKKNS